MNKLGPEVTKVCELRVPGVCIGNRMLQWCHKVKSRFIVTAKDWREAARGCAACHQYYENGKHKVMAAAIDAAIKSRKPHAHSHDT